MPSSFATNLPQPPSVSPVQSFAHHIDPSPAVTESHETTEKGEGSSLPVAAAQGVPSSEGPNVSMIAEENVGGVRKSLRLRDRSARAAVLVDNTSDCIDVCRRRSRRGKG